MGLQEILTEVRNQAQNENTDLIKQVKAQSENMLLDKQKELADLYSNKREALEVELKRLSAKLLAKVELDNKRDFQKMEQELIESALHEAYQDLLQNLRSDASRYEAFLVSLVDGALKLMQEKEISISLAKEDEKYFDSMQKSVTGKLKLLSASRIAGGVVCTSGDTYIDNSIENIFSKMKPDFVKMIADAVSAA